MMTSAPADVDLSESQQPRLYGSYSSTWLLAIIAVVLRLICRKRLSRAGFWWDDYTICLSLVIATANYIAMLIWVHRGVGKHIEVAGPQGASHFSEGLFAIEILYTLTLCCTKFSILLFYLRLFGKSNLRVPAGILACVVTGWGIGVVFSTIFQCTPVRGFWDYSIHADCRVNVYAFFVGNAIPNIITDWALLILPVPYVWRLHQTRVQKLGLCGVFMLAGFICIISIVRLYIMATQLFHTSSTDVTWLFNSTSTWTAVETNIAIVSACLPSLRPILIALFEKTTRSKNASDADVEWRSKDTYGSQEKDAVGFVEVSSQTSDT